MVLLPPIAIMWQFFPLFLCFSTLSIAYPEQPKRTRNSKEEEDRSVSYVWFLLGKANGRDWANANIRAHPHIRKKKRKNNNDEDVNKIETHGHINFFLMGMSFVMLFLRLFDQNYYHDSSYLMYYILTRSFLFIASYNRPSGTNENLIVKQWEWNGSCMERKRRRKFTNLC